MWCAVDDFVINRPIREEWEDFKLEMEGKWSNSILQTLLLLTAMISCQVPLLAITWARDRFVPVLVDYRKFSVIGLLAKHACTSELAMGQYMLSAGRHPTGAFTGKDIVIADPSSMMPVGLLPDFFHNQRTDEEYVEKVSALYAGLVIKITGEGMVRYHIPLDSVKLRPCD